jgi:ATP-dependent DNA helicase RecG
MLQSNIIKETLEIIGKSIQSNQFIDVETSIVELKDLSGGKDWISLKESICAFLNTKGGYVVCGVKERNKSYTLTGFNRNNEFNLTQLTRETFQNDKNQFIVLDDYITLDFVLLQEKTIAVIEVLPLSEDLKYVKFGETYYERVLTRDQVLPKPKLVQHQEYKQELEYSKEISAVKDATIDDLDLDKINQFIIKINITGRKETVKKDLADAMDFLKRRYCVDAATGQITTLGLLLFGKEPFQKLQYRAEVDCYFETGNSIGRDKEYLQDDVLNLIEGSFRFVWGHIKVGRSHIGGGRSEPEYPEKLIRETINNAIAHRDYTIDKFITIKINPGESVEIKNPGSFKEKMLIVLEETQEHPPIKRIIPGVPETKNPKLANILKAFDKIESQGIGMATLVSECLDNQINVPYYDLNIDTVSLVIPSGKLLDEETLFWLTTYEKYISEKLGESLSDGYRAVLAYLYKTELLNRRGFYTILLSRSNNHLEVIQQLQQSGLIHEIKTDKTLFDPIYLLHNDLRQNDFSGVIKEYFTKNVNNHSSQLQFVAPTWDELDRTTKSILNIIYRYTRFNSQSIKPSEITPELYRKLHGKDINPKTYESLGRKVRKICADLSMQGILEKPDGKSYTFRLSQNGLVS